ncbi:MAG: formate/nitrite transporter family protein [Paramuribaculum sp.]|nr:formate/nitrite transporter family protein [Paramuribaculum sp.]
MNVKTPAETLAAAHKAGLAKAEITRQYGRLAILSVLAGCYIAFGGVLSLIVGYGFPEITAHNPAMQKLLSGCVFPIGLILVVVLGAELFTGNNAILMPPALRGDTSWATVALNWLLVWLGNFVGALAFTYIMVWSCGLIDGEPWRSAITTIAGAKVNMSWFVVLLKGIGANWCVCLAVWLALSGHTLLEKMAGCWFPVMAFVALGYEHSIANMFFIPAGIMAGADVSIWQMVWSNLIPATIGNIIGGALLVGCIHSWLHATRK